MFVGDKCSENLACPEDHSGSVTATCPGKVINFKTRRSSATLAKGSTVTDE